jgi:hypothetical protein
MKSSLNIYFRITAMPRIIPGLLPIITCVLGFGGSVIAQTSPSAAVKNIVLVHGGFVDGSGWEGVYKILKKDGYTVAVVQNPTISLGDDVAVTKRTIANQNGPKRAMTRKLSGWFMWPLSHRTKASLYPVS